MKNIFAFLLLSIISGGQAWAGEWISYQTSGASHYQDGTIEVSDWAGNLRMRAVLERDGHQYEVEAYLERVSSNNPGITNFRGSGIIKVRYADGTGCNHRFGTKMMLRGDEIFLRENTPRIIPYNPNGPCTGASQYVWFNHDEPYLQQR